MWPSSPHRFQFQNKLFGQTFAKVFLNPCRRQLGMSAFPLYVGREAVRVCVPQGMAPRLCLSRLHSLSSPAPGGWSVSVSAFQWALPALGSLSSHPSPVVNLGTEWSLASLFTPVAISKTKGLLQCERVFCCPAEVTTVSLSDGATHPPLLPSLPLLKSL